jgi:FAD/FMN-containing dehydrogenase
VPGFNCNPGILVDMALFRDINYDPTTTLVDVGPGLDWEDVYNALCPLHVNVAGATTCQGVGVAGFNLGGGYGNKTNQFGLAIDNIQAMEVVLPTGEVLIADAQNNEDLFFALRVCFLLASAA